MNLKIASISAEIEPYAKSGGLADVAGSLPKALKRQGHQIIVVTPFYRGKIEPEKHKLKKIMENLTIKIDKKNQEKFNIWQGELAEDLPIYLIENEKYFNARQYLYDSTSPDENARFWFFDLAVLKFLEEIKFLPDIIHCHDWQTGLIPYFLKKNFKNLELSAATTVYTIHNLVFQFGHNWWKIAPELRDSGHNGLPDFSDAERREAINFAKRAILNADVINTVSETYAEEIMTKDFGQDLHRILKNRKDRVFGIINGIDYKDYNPYNDPGLHRNYDWHNFKVKEKNKMFLQKMIGLPINKNIPMIGMVTRITEQKGFDLVKEIADIVLRFNLQIVVIGSGENIYMDKLKELMKKNPDKIYANLEFVSSKDTTKIYAGSDILLIPSRFEPCGVIQMIAMRYGAIPVVRHVGGLIDTVYDYNPKNQTGNGFVFHPYDSIAMLIAITRAIETYQRQNEWDKLVNKVMRQSFSWEYPARKYVELFKKAIEIKKLDKEKSI